VSKPSNTTARLASKAPSTISVAAVLLASLLLQPPFVSPAWAAKAKKTKPQSRSVLLKPLTPKTGGGDPPTIPPLPDDVTQQDPYSLVGQLEKLTFGFSKPAQPIKDRLMVLEAAVFHKSYPQLSLEQRTQRLSDTLLGPTVNPEFPPPRLDRPAVVPQQQISPVQQPEIVNQPPAEYQIELPVEELNAFLLEQINQERTQQGLSPLV